MKHFIYLLSGIIITFISCSEKKQFPSFTIHQIDTIGNRMGQTDLVDMDNDGDLDWVTGEASHSNGNIWWFEYKAPNQWIRHDIGVGNTDVGGDCYDVNGDGWMDFWGGTVLFINQKNGSFTKYEVGTTYSHDSQFGDINGDSRIIDIPL